MRLQAFIALFLLWSVGPAHAADPIAMPPQLATFLTQQSEQNLVKSQALRDWNGSVVDCGSPIYQGANVVIGRPPAFDKAGKPVSGEWRVISQLSGCGQTKAFNLLYSFAPNGQMLRTGMLPGSSAADPILQRDGLMYASSAMAKLTPPGCKDIRYLDTAFEVFGRPGAGVPAGREARSWTEKWTVWACGVQGIVKLYFTPDARGTTISTRLDETVKVSPK